MDPNWQRWMMLSISEHFSSGFGEALCHIEGNPKPTKKSPSIYNLRFLGPDFDEKTKDEWHITLTIDCEILTAANNDAPWEHHNRVGAVQALFNSCISVKKYGSHSTDDKSLVGVLDRKTPITATNFTNLDPVSTVSNTAIQATYKMILEG